MRKLPRLSSAQRRKEQIRQTKLAPVSLSLLDLGLTDYIFYTHSCVSRLLYVHKKTWLVYNLTSFISIWWEFVITLAIKPSPILSNILSNSTVYTISIHYIQTTIKIWIWEGKCEIRKRSRREGCMRCRGGGLYEQWFNKKASSYNLVKKSLGKNIMFKFWLINLFYSVANMRKKSRFL